MVCLLAILSHDLSVGARGTVKCTQEFPFPSEKRKTQTHPSGTGLCLLKSRAEQPRGAEADPLLLRGAVVQDGETLSHDRTLPVEGGWGGERKAQVESDGREPLGPH